jgi:hypothetical protein
MLPTGTELYYSAQLTGTNLFAAGVRTADLEASNLYVLDLSAHYRLSNEPRLNPRLIAVALNHNLSLVETLPGTIASPACRG